jgi:predicted secreted Zn-dependent protease|tara:strand:- start:3391 stop:3639 length:249 start_codon:yes stop_codon:yes gene_type:complete
MKKRTRSLLEEINSLAPKKDKNAILESRGTNAISSIINILEMIDANFDSETAQDLNKRIMLSIKNRDPERFNRGIKKIRSQR